MSTQQDNEKIIWVRGNTQQLLIPLEKEVVSPSGDITTVDFYPDEEAVIKVILYNDYRKYEYTPSLDGNLLTITDSGTLAVGCYGVAVTVKNPDGTRLHSNWNHQVVVTATNNSVLKEWDEFKEQDVKARAAIFFFAKGDPGTTDYNELINKPFIPTALVDLTDDESHRTVSDTEKTTWNNKANVVDGKVQAINGVEVTGDSASVSGLFLPFTDLSTNITELLSVIGRNSDKEVLIGHVKAPDLVFAFNNTAVRMTTLAAQGRHAETAYQKPQSGIPASDLTSELQQTIDNVPSILQSISAISDLVPEQASSSNQLADRNFVNSSVATNTANYISNNGEPFTSLAQLEAYSGTLTNNDYAFVVGTDATGNTTYTRYKYNASQQQWSEEYVLNNSSFTAAQWASINSGIVDSDVAKLNALPTKTALEALFAAKQDALVSGTNIKTINNQSVLGSGNLDVKDVFIAEYGVTTYQQVLDAYNAGKVVVVVYNTRLYFCVRKDVSNDLMFAYVEGSNIYRIILSSNGWGSASNVPLEETQNKATDFTTLNNTKYPTTQAVADYVSDIVGDINSILETI